MNIVSLLWLTGCCMEVLSALGRWSDCFYEGDFVVGVSYWIGRRYVCRIILCQFLRGVDDW